MTVASDPRPASRLSMIATAAPSKSRSRGVTALAVWITTGISAVRKSIFELLQDDETVELGHLQVEHDQVRPSFSRRLESAQPVRRLGHVVPLGPQVSARQVPGDLVVVDDEGGPARPSRADVPRSVRALRLLRRFVRCVEDRNLDRERRADPDFALDLDPAAEDGGQAIADGEAEAGAAHAGLESVLDLLRTRRRSAAGRRPRCRHPCRRRRTPRDLCPRRTGTRS